MIYFLCTPCSIGRIKSNQVAGIWFTFVSHNILQINDVDFHVIRLPFSASNMKGVHPACKSIPKSLLPEDKPKLE